MRENFDCVFVQKNDCICMNDKNCPATASHTNKENIEYLKAQELFLKNADEVAWSIMWNVGLTLSRKNLRKILNKTNHKMNSADFDDKAIESCEYVLRRYRKNYKNGKKYKITTSPCSAFHFGAMHALYYEKQLKNRDLMNEAVLFCDLFKDNDHFIF